MIISDDAPQKYLYFSEHGSASLVSRGDSREVVCCREEGFGVFFYHIMLCVFVAGKDTTTTTTHPIFPHGTLCQALGTEKGSVLVVSALSLGGMERCYHHPYVRHSNFYGHGRTDDKLNNNSPIKNGD